MSPNTSPAESEVSDVSKDSAGTDSTTDSRTQFAVERQALCNRIEALEQELARERKRRAQIVDRYERLLAQRQTNENDRSQENERGGWLRGLF